MFVRVHRPGALTFAAISEVGVGGRRVGGGHRLNKRIRFDRATYAGCRVNAQKPSDWISFPYCAIYSAVATFLFFHTDSHFI